MGEGGTLSEGVGDGCGPDGPPPGTEDVGVGPVTGPSVLDDDELPPGRAGFEADGEAEAAADALPDAPGEGLPCSPDAPGDADGDSEAPLPEESRVPLSPGVEASWGPGGSVDTPGCRMGAIGGCLGSGFGVIPDTHA